MTGARVPDVRALAGVLVLLVEDHPPSARLATMILRDAGAKVVGAATATEAAQLVFSGLRPAIVVLDLELPDLTGMDLAKILRSADATRDVPIVAMTASGLAFGERAARTAGCDAFVRKPIDATSFPRTLAALLRTPRAPVAPVAASSARPSILGRHSAILDALPQAVCVVRALDLHLIYANQRFVRFAGQPVAELLGMPIAVATIEGAHPSRGVREEVSRQLDAHDEANLEVCRRSDDAGEEWVQLTASRLDDPEHGELWLLVVRDVTQRRRADHDLQHALAVSEIKLSTFADSGVLAIVTADLSGRIVHANDLFLQLVGRTRAELEAGLYSADLNPPESLARDQRAYGGLAAGDAVQPYEKEYLRPDGTRVPVLVGGGKLDATTLTGYAIDLTEKRRGQAALRESQRRLDALWTSAMVGVVIADDGGVVHEANDAYLRLIGSSRAELAAGKIDYAALTPPEHRARIGEAIAELAARGFAEPWETETLTRDGARVPILVGVAAIDAHRRIALITDLSARARTEEQLRHTEEQLRHAQKNEAIGRLAGGVAHDFNNLLSVIVSYSALILDELAPDAPMREDVEEIRGAATRATELTRQLALVSRQRVATARPVDPGEVLHGMRRILERLLGEDVTIACRLDADLGRIRIDPTHLEQVLLNLTVNARDAMPGGGALTIDLANVDVDAAHVRAHITARRGPHVRLSVTDTGAGIDPDTASRIFDPFFTTKQVGKGTGLGLSIVSGIVEQCGGHLWAESQPGRGATFHLFFPTLVGDCTAAAPTPEAGVALRGAETILLVEDSDAVRRVARDVLQRHGYTVLLADGPADAMLRCQEHPDEINLLLTDVVMPQMSGPELARRLTILRPAMRVLCMSGYTDERIDASAGAGIAFIEKPFSPQTLTQKVRELLDRPAPR